SPVSSLSVSNYMRITQSVDDKATVCHVFPASTMDAVLWVGLYGELWVDKVEEGAKPVQVWIQA
ncbi:hypothetical protein SARC_15011, partial [Sphaeroforma arctica JP610]